MRIQKLSCRIVSRSQHSGYVVFGTTRIAGRNFFERAIALTDFEKHFTDGQVKGLSLDSQLRSGFDQASDDYLENVRQSIKNPVWQWNSRTLRKNGTLVFSPRNIVDSGELLRGAEKI